ncbi:hypothetical protein D9619_011544 [Psilocybe cf. subviscida]|uniref:F-box domain-containing protein n=1 Tax=Psilocybe cf. subviscida TaxID=2480587 RepID=A0A8H5BT51_9AGAR|nr:hypothetical protein D9619_011544 [Psilocybe cf. subviscida]
MKAFSQGVPPEILTQIFEWIYLVAVRVDNPRGQPVDGKHVRRLCWPVSQVCKYWREVTLAAPFLWTYLPTINLDDDELSSSSQQLECLKALIPRTRNHTLHIAAVSATETDFDKCLEVVDYIAEYSERWESLFVRASPDYLEEYFGEVRGYLPGLEMLKLELLDGGGTDLTLFGDAPNLKFVHITGQPAGCLDLDTQTLLHLYDDTAILMHNLRPTHEFPQLNALDVIDTYDTFYYSNLSDVEDVVLFPVLKILDYSCGEEFPADAGFLNFAKTPALEELSVTADVGDTIGCLMDLHGRSGSLPLKHLRLRAEINDYPEHPFSDLLKLLPDIESLDINFPDICDISRLTITQDPNILAPRLKKCSFICYGNMVDDDAHHLISQLASARCSLPSRGSSNTPHPAAQDGEGVVESMELFLHQDLTRHISPPRTTSGFGYGQYGYPAILPIRLEPWYYQRKKDQAALDSVYNDALPRPSKRRWQSTLRSVYSKAVEDICIEVLPEYPEVQADVRRRRVANLIRELQSRYNAENLVNFLEANTSTCLICLAFILKDQFRDSDDKLDDDSPYIRVVRLLRQVKMDLMKRLDEFHWIWETSPDLYSLRYIPDGHEMRKDCDKFANAVLGLSDDVWILGDF